jgi:hypothetical protein
MSADVASVVGVTFRSGWTRACAMSGFVGGDSRQTGDRSAVVTWRGEEMGDVGTGSERGTSSSLFC